MNFFKKKLEIQHHYPYKKQDIEPFISLTPNSYPKYYNRIPKKKFNTAYKKFFPFDNTIKTCPGFINLYKRSILIKCPWDTYIKFTETDIDFQVYGADMTSAKYSHTHDNQQFLDYAPKNKYKFIIKVQLPFNMNASFSSLMSNADYHFQDFKVLPGILPKQYKDCVSIFIPIEKNREFIQINKGDPLFLLTPLCENKITINYKQIKPEPFLTSLSSFSNLKNFVLDKLT